MWIATEEKCGRAPVDKEGQRELRRPDRAVPLASPIYYDPAHTANAVEGRAQLGSDDLSRSSCCDQMGGKGGRMMRCCMRCSCWKIACKITSSWSVRKVSIRMLRSACEDLSREDNTTCDRDLASTTIKDQSRRGVCKAICLQCRHTCTQNDSTGSLLACACNNASSLSQKMAL